VLGAFLQQAFHQLQAEGHRVSNQLWVIVAGIGGSTVGEGVAQLIDGDLLNCAAPVCDGHQQGAGRSNQHFLSQPRSSQSGIQGICCVHG
jgi:hypothetical protein